MLGLVEIEDGYYHVQQNIWNTYEDTRVSIARWMKEGGGALAQGLLPTAVSV
jgi:hypothetical protein